MQTLERTHNIKVTCVLCGFGILYEVTGTCTYWGMVHIWHCLLLEELPSIVHYIDYSVV